MDSESDRSASVFQRALLITGVLLVAFNLRPAITALSPLAERLQQDGFSRETIGLLSTIPLILFGVAGFWASWIGNRIGIARALVMGLSVLGVGSLMRSVSGQCEAIYLWGGTLAIGAGIALGNVLLPSLVKERYPQKVGSVTGLYSTALNIGAASGIAFAVPVANYFEGSWRISLAVWGVVALFSLLFWIPEWREKHTSTGGASTFVGIRKLIRNGRAWQVAIFLGLQSTLFYSSMMWLPTVLQHRGISEQNAAAWATAMQILGCVASFLIPTLASRSKSQSSWLMACGSLCTIGLAGVLWLPVAWAGFGGLVLGFSLNSCFALGLMILALRSRTPKTAAALSSMSQAFGYLIAAPGPWLVGKLSLTSGGWNLAFGFLMLVSIFNVIVGGLAGRSGELDVDAE